MRIHIKTINRSKHVRLFLIFGIISVGFISCTKNFETYNTNPNALTSAQSTTALPGAFSTIEQGIIANYQVGQNLSADAYGGYMMSPTPFKASYNLNYGLVDGWNTGGFNAQYSVVLADIYDMSKVGVRNTHADWWAVALLLKVEALHRVTDKFGPIPYSKVGTSINDIPYDSQKDIYNQFFAELDTAATSLQTYMAAHPGSTPLAGYDIVYNGDYTKWLKFANSLRLRLAMHIVKIDPVTAQAQAEKAMAALGGLMTTTTDNFYVSQAGGRTNDLYQVTNDWGDNRANAALTSYMTGYKDPRAVAYLLPATDPLFVGKYIGIRIGSAIASKSDYETYASINTVASFTATAPQLLMAASETWFLKAEAALRGWAGAGDMKTDYETGIQNSMTEWGAASGSAAYLADATSTEAAYVDPKNGANNSPALSTITIKWDPAASKEVMLERIITQKWLATFPEGQEAWTTYRRTGYPKLFPVVVNTSNGTIDTQIQIRRLNYPSSEYSTNTAAVKAAVATLGGADVGGTRLWWDVNKANF